MKSIWRHAQTFSDAEDITRLQHHVQHLTLQFHEVVEEERIQLIRKRWRLFAEPAGQVHNMDENP